jgi:hypothetical protein
MIKFYSALATLHESRINHWTWLGSLGLTAHTECWLLTADWSPPWFELNSWLLIPYCSVLSMSLVWLLTALCCWVPTLPDFLLSKSTLLSRSSTLVREHLIQRFSLSSTQRWLAYSVAAGIQEFGLCCVGSFQGSVCLRLCCHWNTRSYCGCCIAVDFI